jgi:hypothetical protein
MDELGKEIKIWMHQKESFLIFNTTAFTMVLGYGPQFL